MSDTIINQVNLFIKNPSLKEEAIFFREQGLIHQNISNILNVPVATIQYWIKDIKLTKEQKQNIKENSFKKKSSFWFNQRLQYQQEGIVLAKKYMDNPLFGIMCGLYWGEGHKPTNKSKGQGALDLGNTDLDMIKLWIKCLNKFFNINNNDIKFRIHYCPNDLVTIEQAKNYWSTNLKLNKKLFGKTFIKNKTIRNNHPYGICHLTVYSIKYLFQMIGAMKYIAGLQDTDKWNY